MKKSLIALAVAGAFSAPAFAATENVDVYGVIHFALEDDDTEKVVGGVTEDSDPHVVDRVSRIGFKGAEDLGGGLSAIWQVEQQINATQDSSDSAKNTAFGGAGLRNTFVGLKGGFGTVLMGRHDTPYKISTGKYDLFSDTIGDYNAGPGVELNVTSGTVDVTSFKSTGVIDNNQDYRSPQTIAYVSPNFSGLTVAAATVVTDTLGNLDNEDDTFDAFSLSGNYDNGPLSVAAGYQSAELLDSTAWKLGGGYAFGNFKVAGLYESVEYDAADLEITGWQVNGAFAMGAVTLKGAFGSKNFEAAGSDEDFDQWILGADYNLSKRTVAYAAVTNADVATINVDLAAATVTLTDDDVTTWALGMKHSF